MASALTPKELYQLQAVLINAVAVFAVEAYNFVLQTPGDVMVWGHQIRIWRNEESGRKVNPAFIAYTICRWSILSVNIPAFLLVFGTPANCQATLIIFYVAVTIAEIAAAVIFALRTISIWHGRRWVKLVMFGGVLFLVAVWIAIIPGLRADTLPVQPTYGATTCANTRNDFKWWPLAYFATAMFDLLVVSLTLLSYVQFRKNLVSQSSLLQIFYRDAGIYFALSFAANLFAAIWQVSLKNPLLIDVTQPYATAVLLGAAPQVYQNLLLCKDEVTKPSFRSGAFEMSGERPSQSNMGLAKHHEHNASNFSGTFNSSSVNSATAFTSSTTPSEPIFMIQQPASANPLPRYSSSTQNHSPSTHQQHLHTSSNGILPRQQAQPQMIPFSNAPFQSSHPYGNHENGNSRIRVFEERLVRRE